MGLSEIVVMALTEGGTIGIAALGWAAWFWERRRAAQREDQLLELATAQVQATAEHDAAIDANTKVLEHLDRTVDLYTRERPS